MTSKKTTRRALLSSVMALILCCAMLVGSTFAWFTDEVTSAGNIIQSGTLDVDLVNADGESMEGKVIDFVAADGRAQDAILWEPGCTYKTEPVCVLNKGNLALKYQIVINGIDGDAKLLEAIEWKVTVGTTEYALDELNGTLLPGKNTDAIVLSGHMKEEAGNEYQGLTAEGISITVYATQLNSENDSFGPDYDETAPLPGAIIDPTFYATLQEAIDVAVATEGGATVKLGEDVVLTETITIPAGATVGLDLNGHTLSYTNDVAEASSAITNEGTLTITNGTVTYKGVGDTAVSPTYATNTITNSGTLVIDGATIINTTEAGASYAIDNSWGNSKLTVNSGNIKSEKIAIRLLPGCDVTINGGEITSQNGYAVIIQKLSNGDATNLTINGGTFTSYRTDFKMALYSTANGGTHAGTTVEINGGTFNGDVGFGGGDKTTTENVTINGGTFNGDVYRYVTGGYELIYSDGKVADAYELKMAIAQGGTVTLEGDITLTEGVTVPADANVVLDLNGHTLSYTTDVPAASSAITNKGTLTITNGTVTYQGVGDSTNGYATNTITNSGTLVIDGATIINTTEAGASYAIDNSWGNSKLTVNSGNIKSEKIAIRLLPGCDVTINGGEITSQNGYAVIIQKLSNGDATNLTINGGTFTSYRTDFKMALYSTANGGTHAGTTVKITGGTFNGDVGFGGGDKTTTENVTITGGTFNGALGRYLANDGWEDIAKP